MPRKINLSLVINDLWLGGAERLVLDLIKRYDQNVYNIHLLTVRGGGKLENEYRKTGVKLSLFDKRTKLGFGLIMKFRNYFRQEKIDIVHTHLFGGDTWGRIAAFLAGVPVVVSTEHNLNLDEGKIKKLVKRLLSKKTTKIFAVSGAVKDYQVAVEKITPEKIEIIYNGIDLRRFAFKTDYQFNPEQTTLGIIGRLEPQKGHQVLLKALSGLVQKYPKLKLKIIGEGSLKEELTELTNSLGLADQVEFLPPQENVQEFFSQLDLLIMPSNWEGLGIIVLEALAWGLPVIASDADGLKEIIKDNYNGFLFPAGDDIALAAKIASVIKQPEVLPRIRSAGRKTVEEKFDIEKIAMEYQNYYRNLYEMHFN